MKKRLYYAVKNNASLLCREIPVDRTRELQGNSEKDGKGSRIKSRDINGHKFTQNIFLIKRQLQNRPKISEGRILKPFLV